MKQLIVCLCLGLGLSACQPTTEPTIRPSPTDRPTATPTLTPTSSTSDITIILSIDAEQLPADGLTTRVVTAQVQAHEDIFDNLAGLPVFFSAFGGGEFLQAQAALEQAKDCNGLPCYHASAVYIVGESVGQTPVTLRATLDVPNLGRIQGTREINLVRQEIALIAPPVYLVQADTVSIPLTFELRVDQQDKLGGSYKLLMRIADGGGGISTKATSQPTQFTSLVASGGTQTIYYTPPAMPPVGGTELCIAVERRDTLPPLCRSILWGYPVENFSVFSTITPQVLRAVNNNIVEARLGSGVENKLSVYSLRYEIALRDPLDMSGKPYLIRLSDRQELAEGQAVYGELGRGLNYNGFNLSQPFNGVLRWTATTIGQDNQSIDRSFETLLAHQALIPHRNAVLSCFLEPLSAQNNTSQEESESPIWFAPTPLSALSGNIGQNAAQECKSSLSFNPDEPMDWEYRVYALSPYDSRSTTTRVLARFYVPQEAYDHQTGCFTSDTIFGRTRLNFGRDNIIVKALGCRSYHSMLFYVSPDIQVFATRSGEVSGYYYLVYAFFKANTRSLRP